jgi:hypothetical protein
MREEIAILAGPRGWGVTRESWLANAADKVENVPYRMIKSFFYGEIQDDNHWAAIEIKRAVEIIEAQREAAALATQLETIISGLNTTDPDFHRPTIAALSVSLRQLRGEDRPGTHHKGEVKLGFDPPHD